jgi:hypothetical protein
MRRSAAAVIAAVLLAAAGPLASAQSLFSAPAFTQVDPGTALTTSMPRSAIVADFNQDGLPDVAIAEDGGIRVAFGDGAGGFTGYHFTPINFVTTPYYTYPQLAGAPDLNLDGFPDLVMQSSAMNVSVQLNDGLAGFAFSTPVPASSTPNTCCPGYPVLADLDGTPPVELVMKDFIAYPTYVQDMLRIYTFNPITNAFQYAQTFNLPIGESVGAIACGDFNGDYQTDIVYAAATGYYPTQVTSLRALVNVGGGQFQPLPGSPFPLPQSTGCGTCSFTVPCHPFIDNMCASDTNGDGIPDLVVFGLTHQPLSSCHAVWTYQGSASSFLVPPTQGRGLLPVNLPSNGLWFADVDDDGQIDVLRGNVAVHAAQVFGVDGTQTVAFPFTYGYCTGPIAQAVGDMNLDGTPDVVFAASRWPVGNTCPTFIGTALNLSRRRPGCGTPVKFLVGTPNPGNPSFSMKLVSGLPNAPAILGVSLAEAGTPLPGCILGLDVSPANLILPNQLGLGLTTTGPSGTASLTFAIPGAPSLVGTVFYAQWIFQDAAGPLQLSGATWSSSISRRILIW